MVNHFWQRVDAILEDVSVTETIVRCQTINLNTIIFQSSENYGSPTSVTRLNVAPNMADPISLNEKKRLLKWRQRFVKNVFFSPKAHNFV